ncbi:MAG: CPA2 family monovalent cation:H+ antiporter-2 [Parasphingorhabdus sp.]|jgi:CPA2 family monovalent cation:H+ antiporter-2
MAEHFFEQLLAIMSASLVATMMLRRLRLPNIIAYLLAGAIVGPHLMGWVNQPADFAFLAEFGVVFLLFSLGLEFSLPKLVLLRASVFGLGGIQVVFCTLVFGGAVWLWGASLESAIIIAGALALSSTAIVTRELSDLRQVHSRHGQLSIGVLLFQDLAAVVFLILVPVLGGDETVSLWQSLGWALAKGALLTVVLLSVGKWLLPPLYREIALARSEEVFVLVTLVIVMLAAWLTHSFHLSMALGGFVIGMMLGESPFRHQINSDIRGFKDILMGLFFVTIGMNLQIELLLEFWPRLLVFVGLLVSIKAVLIGLLVRVFGDSRKSALKTGMNLAQAGEFGLALLALGVMHEVLPRDQASFIILVCVFSMALSPFLIRHGNWISNLLGPLVGDDNTRYQQVNQALLPEHDHVIIGGFGRVGQTVARLLDVNDVPYIAIDRSLDVVSNERDQNQNVIYGDCTNIEILRSCRIENARMAILTFGSIEMARNSIEHIRADGIAVPIIVRCSEHGNFSELLSLGADHVVPEMLDASLATGEHVLVALGFDEEDIQRQLEMERTELMRHEY